MDNVKRGEVLQGQARKNTAAAFAFGFAVIAISSPPSPPSGSLIRQNRASHYGKKPYKCRTVSNLGNRKEKHMTSAAFKKRPH
jgi:hypothetical protein